MSEQTPLEAAEAFLELAKFKHDGAVVSGQAWDADHASHHLYYGTVRALVAQIRLDEQRLADRDRLTAENQDLRNQISTLRHIIDTLKPFIIPIWERVLREVQAAWKILEPIIEAIDAGPRHGGGNLCKVCDRGIIYYEDTDSGGVVIHAEWQHKIEPADGHKAVPPHAGWKPVEPELEIIHPWRVYYSMSIPGVRPWLVGSFATKQLAEQLVREHPGYGLKITFVADDDNIVRPGTGRFSAVVDQTAPSPDAAAFAAVRGREMAEQVQREFVEDEPQPNHVCAICDGKIEFIDSGDGQPGVWRHALNVERDAILVDHNAQPKVTHEQPQSKQGDHSTCVALVGRGAEGTTVCGFEILLWPDPRNQMVPVWRHVDVAIDAMHDAQFGGPA